jgi:hypothetical protein
MARMRGRRAVLVFGLAALVMILAGVVVYAQVIDPGDKGDTSTGLVTPTLAAQAARTFDIQPDRSQVDFVTDVRGVPVEGVFPVKAGTITLEPEGGALRVHVYLEIDVDGVSTSALVTPVLRGAMKTGDYPVAFYVAESRGLVPVTEEEISFDLDGELDVHNVAAPHSMTVRAQLVGGALWAVATSDLDLAIHEVEFPAMIGNSTIQLTARLEAVESQAGS